MDLTSLVWFLGIFLAFQWHMDTRLMALVQRQYNGQGVERMTNPHVRLEPNYDAEFEQYYHLKW